MANGELSDRPNQTHAENVARSIKLETACALAQLGTDFECRCQRMMGTGLAGYLVALAAVRYESTLPLSTLATFLGVSKELLAIEADRLLNLGLVLQRRSLRDRRARGFSQSRSTMAAIKPTDETLGYSLVHALAFREDDYDNLVEQCLRCEPEFPVGQAFAPSVPFGVLCASHQAREALIQVCAAQGTSPAVALAVVHIDRSPSATGASSITGRLCDNDAEAIALLNALDEQKLAAQPTPLSDYLEITDAGRALVDGLEQALTCAFERMFLAIDPRDMEKVAMVWDALNRIDWLP